MKNNNLFRPAILGLAMLLPVTACDKTEKPKPAPEPAVKAAPAPEPPKIETTAFAVPILEGQAETHKAFLADYKPGTVDAQQWDDARKALGLTKEVVYTQQTPMGPLAIVYQEGTGLAHLMHRVMASTKNADKKFQAMIKDVHGMDLTANTAMPPAPEMIISYSDGGTRYTPYVFAVPVAADQMTAHTEFIAAVKGDKAQWFAATRKTAGISREMLFKQQTPMGLFIIVAQESATPADMHALLAADESDAGNWFIEQIKTVHGVDLRGDKPMEPNVLGIDWVAK